MNETATHVFVGLCWFAVICTIVVVAFINYNDFTHDPVIKPTLSQHLTSINKPEMLDLPLSKFHVNASHNSYINGPQIGGMSRAANVVSCLNLGARCIEIDIHKYGKSLRKGELPDSTPIVVHGNDTILEYDFAGLDNVLYQIQQNAFKHTDDPLFLYLEIFDADDEEMTKAVATSIKQYLGDRLYEYSFDDVAKDPTKYFVDVPIRNLIGKICIVINYYGMTSAGHAHRNKYLFPIVHGTADEPTNGWWGNKTKIIAQSSKNPPLDMFTHVTRVYPDNAVRSLNYDPQPFWDAGYTFASLNFQTNDVHLKKNEMMFRAANIVPKRSATT